MMKFYDVSLPITEETIVFPGNPKPKMTQYATIPKDITNETLICMGSHTGTHVDTNTSYPQRRRRLSKTAP